MVFASFQVDALMGYSGCPAGKTQQQCHDDNQRQLSEVKRDRFDTTWCAAEQIVRSAVGSDPILQYLAEAQFKMCGTMGLRRYDGGPKPSLMRRWTAARALPIDERPAAA